MPQVAAIGAHAPPIPEGSQTSPGRQDSQRLRRAGRIGYVPSLDVTRIYSDAHQNVWTAAASLCAWNDLETFLTPACFDVR
jgi:hypothetical protein